MAEFLPLVDIGDMDLHAGDGHGLECVQNGVAVVGEGPWIHHNGVVGALGGVDGVDDGAFVVGLEALGGTPVGGGKAAQAVAEGLVGILTVNPRLPLAQQVQVGAVDDQKFRIARSSK